jgi:hypothetical protein
MKPLSVAVRLPAAAHSAKACLESLHALPGLRIRTLEEVRSVQELDLILDLTSEEATLEQIHAPRYGYWTFLYGERPRRGSPGLIEILQGQRAALVRLARLLPAGRAEILAEGSVKTVPHSASKTARRLLEAASRWPARVLRELTAGGALPAGGQIELATHSFTERLAMGAFLPFALVRNAWGRIRQELTREHWRIGIVEQPIERLVESFDPGMIRWLDIPFEGFLADPFGIAGPDGGLTILAEAFRWKDRRGGIAAIRWRRDAPLTVEPTSLRLDSHLSYPHLIEDAGQIYCIPESAAQGCVQLYRAAEFPGRWVADQMLLEGFAGADTTVVHYGDAWWMFTCNHADQDQSNLYIFRAAQLRGPWVPHEFNPVKCDLRSTRPAGTPFIAADGMLYRPAQDCSQVYGGAVVINRVTRLSLEDFAEAPVAHLRPDPGGPCPDGLHTLSAVGNLTLVDGKRHTFVPPWISSALSWLRRPYARRPFLHAQDRLRQPAT